MRFSNESANSIESQLRYLESGEMDRYNTFWRRVGAGFVDALVFVPVGLVGRFFHLDTAGGVVALLWSVIFNVGPIVYRVWMHSRFGQTLGKMAIGVSVLDSSEEKRMTLRQACLSEIGLIVLTVGDLAFGGSVAQTTTFGLAEWATVIWLLLEIVTTLSNSKRRALHDWIAHSVVVRGKA